MRERLAEVWEDAFSETNSLGARLAGGFMVGYGLLALVSLGLRAGTEEISWGGTLFAIAVDLGVGAALLAQEMRARHLALGRLLLGLFGVLLSLLVPGLRDPLLIGSQVLFLAGMSLLLLGEPERGRLGAGVGVLLLLLWPVLVPIVTPFTQRTPLAGLLLAARRVLEPGPVAQVQGDALTPFQMRFPATGWRQLRPGVLPHLTSRSDRAWVLPEADAVVFVKSTYVPAASVDLDGLIARFLEAGATPGRELLESATLDGPFDAARRLHLRDKNAPRGLEYLTTLWVRGDRVFEITAHAPRHRFPGLRQELEGILDSFAFQPPRRPSLSEQTLAAVNESTVMVLTAEGSGSGFIIESGNGRSVILTNDHVLRGSRGQLLDAVGVVVQDSQGRRSLWQDTLTETMLTDPSLDLAVVRLLHRHTPALPVLALRHSKTLHEQSPVVVVGYPFGGALAAGNAFPAATVNGGWVLPRAAKSDATQLSVDVGINPGNSGGPMVDGRGRVVGVAVAHRRGSETSYAISTEAVQSFLERDFPSVTVRFADPPGEEPDVAAEAPSVEFLSAELEARVRNATVLVRSGAHVTSGVVVERLEEHLLVLASTEVLGPKWTRDLPPPPITVRAHPERPGSSFRPAEVLRVGTDVLLLSARLEQDGVKPLALGSGERLRTGAVLFGLGFKVDAEGRLPQANPPARLERGSLAGRQQDEHGALELLQVDLGINHRQTGGPVFDLSGALVGLTINRVSHTNMSLTLTGEQLRESLRGGIRDAAWRFERLPSGRCEVLARVVLDDPLGTLESVSLRLGPDDPQWQRWEPRGIPALGAAVLTQKPRYRQQWMDLRTEVLCANSNWRLQLEVRDAQGARRTLARRLYIPTGEGPPTESFGRTGGTYLSRNGVPELLTFAMEPLTPAASCTEEAGRCERECGEGQADSCWSLSVKRAREGLQTEALSLTMRACSLGHVEACIEQGFLASARNSSIRGAVAPMSMMNTVLERECANRSARACNARDASYPLLLAQRSDGCASRPGECLDYARMLWNGPGSSEQRGLRAVNAVNQSCDMGSPQACGFSLSLVAQGKSPGSFALVAKTLESRCLAEKMGQACVDLARMHARGLGLSRNTLRAAELLALGCVLRDPSACSMLPESQRE